MKSRWRSVLIICIGWLAVGFMLDRVLFINLYKPLMTLLSFKLRLTIPTGELNLPRMGVIAFFLIPYIIAGFLLFPWKTSRDKSTIKNWGNRLWRIFYYFIWILILILAGEFLVIILGNFISEDIRNFAQKFSVEAQIFIRNYELGSLRGSAGAVLGLILGGIIFLKKGIKDVIEMGLNLFIDK